jgi:hypothetical protein
VYLRTSATIGLTPSTFPFALAQMIPEAEPKMIDSAPPPYRRRARRRTT